MMDSCAGKTVRVVIVTGGYVRFEFTDGTHWQMDLETRIVTWPQGEKR